MVSSTGLDATYVSKIDMVTAALRSRILSREIGPGTQLRQRDLAAMLNVSVTPVREALRRLESEGLVSYDPHCGATVVEVDAGPTSESYLIRAALESLAAAMAAERIEVEELTELEALLERMEGERDDFQAYADLSRTFHLRIYDAARAPLLRSLINRLSEPVSGASDLEDLGESIDESISDHQVIFDALKSGDATAARDITRRHVLTAAERAGAAPTAATRPRRRRSTPKGR